MAFTRATGKHRRPTRIHRTTARAAGVAALAATGVVGAQAAPALAAETAPSSRPASTLSSPSATRSPSRSTPRPPPQKQAAAKAKKAARRRRARRPPRRPKTEREAKERAAREAERKRLNTFVAPIADSYVSTGYKTGGSLWSSGCHTRHRLPRRERHRRPRGRLRQGRRGRLGRRLRQPGSDQDARRHVHPVRPPVVHRCLGGPDGHPGPADRPVRRHRQHHRPAPALRGPDRPEYGSDIDPLAYLPLARRERLTAARDLRGPGSTRPGLSSFRAPAVQKISMDSGPPSEIPALLQ